MKDRDEKFLDPFLSPLHNQNSFLQFSRGNIFHAFSNERAVMEKKK